MQLTVACSGTKHTLEAAPEDTVRSVKQKLSPLVSMAAAEMKLVHKGKACADDEALSTLGVADGAKLMVLRGKASVSSISAAKAALATPAAPAAPAAPAEPSAAAAAVPAAPAPAPVLGSGDVLLTVVQGKTQLPVRCDASTTVRDLKLLLEPAVGSAPVQQRLLVKGKEAADGSTVEALGLGGGGKLMLLFRGGHHRLQEGAAAIAEGVGHLAELRGRIEKTRHKLSKRLMTGAEALAALGELDAEVAELVLDLRNATVAPGEPTRLKEEKLAELAALAEAVAEARKEEASAELARQLRR